MLMYVSENWAQNRFERRKIETAQMNFTSRLSGYIHTDDRIRNTTIRFREKISKARETSGRITS